VATCSIKECDEPRVVGVRSPDPMAWPAGIYDACSFEHAQIIVNKLLGRMFLEESTSTSSGFAPDVEEPSATGPAS
jgi:hypothetical protein